MQRTRPFAPDDLARLPAISDAQINPRGDCVAYVVGWLDPELDELQSRIWIVPVDGGAAAPFTSGPNDTSPRWSLDGARLAYVARVEGKQQLMLIDRDGAEGRALVEGSYAGGVGSVCWSPDGKRLAFTTRSVPDGRRDRSPQVIRRLRYRHNGSGYVGDGTWQVYVADLESGQARAISDPDWHHFHPAWSPDGQQLALVTTRRPDWDLEWVWDIFTCAADGSNLQQLTGSAGVCIAPAWSPDGSQIAYFDNRCPSTGTTVDYHLWAVAAGGGEPRDLSAPLDRGAITTMLPGDTPPPRWLPDASVCWLTRNRGCTQISRVDAGGAVTPLVDGEGTAGAPSAAAASGLLAYTWSDASSPPEVWSCDVTGGRRRRLTAHAVEPAAAFASSTPCAFSLPAEGGVSVESWLWLPAGATSGQGPFPTLLELHGGPHGAVGPAFSARTRLLTGHGYAVLGVNFRGSGGYGQAFADLILGDWGAKEFADAMAAVDHLVTEGIADPARLGVLGGSYGGFMTNYTISHTDRFAAAVTIATISTLDTLSYLTDHWESIDWDNGGPPFARPDYYREHSPVSFVSRITTPLLILHGDEDYTCSVSEADMLFAALRKQRKQVELVRYPGEAHGAVSRGRPRTQIDAHRRLLAWFQQYITPFESGASPP